MSRALMTPKFAILLCLVVLAFFASGAFTADAGARLLSAHEMREQARGGEPTCDRAELWARCTDFVFDESGFFRPLPGACTGRQQADCTGATSCQGCNAADDWHVRCWDQGPKVMIDCIDSPLISGGCGVFRNPPMSCFWDTQGQYCRCGGGGNSGKSCSRVSLHGDTSCVVVN